MQRLIYEGEDGSEISPNVTVEELSDLLPDEISVELSHSGSNKSWGVKDIPVVIEEGKRKLWEDCQKYYYDDDYGNIDIPAGSKIKVSKRLTDHPGTFGTPAWDQDRDETIMVSAGHLWKDKNDDGDWAWQPNVNNSSKDGTVYVQVYNEDQPDPDYALLSPDDESYI